DFDSGFGLIQADMALASAPGDSSVISINNVTVSEGNTGATNAVFTATLSPASNHTVTVNFSTADSTATAGSDYVTSSGILVFNPGETTKTITVLVNGDTVNEADETFFVNLSSPSNATIAAGQGVGTIINDDALPSISINDVSAAEGNTGTTNAVFTVTRSSPNGQTVTVHFPTADGTATAGTDYLASNGTLTFNPGETTKTVAVVVIGDTVVEGNESFFVNLTSATNATIADGQGIATIVDDADGASYVWLGSIAPRNRVLTSDNVMIGGFIIDGLTPLRVLLRSRGPSLAAAPFF